MLLPFVLSLSILCIDKTMGRPAAAREVSHPVLSGKDQSEIIKTENDVKSRTVQWPPDYNTFHLPKMLNNEDKIIISGELPKNPESFVLTLVADNKIVFELFANFISNITTISFYDKQGQKHVSTEEPNATGTFPSSTFILDLQLISDKNDNLVNIRVSDMPLCLQGIVYGIQDITHVILNGAKVNEIGFVFN